jgi:hypothetical protein
VTEGGVQARCAAQKSVYVPGKLGLLEPISVRIAVSLETRLRGGQEGHRVWLRAFDF